MASGVTAVAYETVTDARGGLPLLAPMSEVAGRLSIQAAATALQKAERRARHSARRRPRRPARQGRHHRRRRRRHPGGARLPSASAPTVTILDRSLPRLRELDDMFDGRVVTRYSTRDAIAEEVAAADAVIGAVLVPGATAPKLVTRAMLATMKPGAVLVDVAIDQGGCFETSHADHPRRADLRRRRHRPLLRRQHAGRRAAHLERGAQPRDAALRPGARRPRPRRASPPTRTSATASTSTPAASPTRPSPKASTSISPTRSADGGVETATAGRTCGPALGAGSFFVRRCTRVAAGAHSFREGAA